MLIKTVILSNLFFFYYSFLQGKAYKDTTPLHKYFESNYDSTIIYNQWSSWNSYPGYFIIAKKGNLINYFSYQSPYRGIQGNRYPVDLHKRFIDEDIKFKFTIPDTNRYFLPVYIHPSKRELIWTEINGYNIWSLKEVDEKAYSCEIYDDASDTYHLITKNGIRTLTFYAAEFYERCKPGNINLINDIKIKHTILTAFGY